MIVEAKLASFKHIKLHEFALRFLFGGLCTMAAGLIASHFGPRIGGLFLAFPAIFPASASLVESHEIAHKRQIGHNGQQRGRVVAGIDAMGTALACTGLIAFALVVWKMLLRHNPWIVIASASFVWLSLSVTLWALMKSRVFRRRQHNHPRMTEDAAGPR